MGIGGINAAFLVVGLLIPAGFPVPFHLFPINYTIVCCYSMLVFGRAITLFLISCPFEGSEKMIM